ncbi:nuclear GTP-binding protein [Cryptococcus wingfieldii CBS 7118]|uniref:Nuclear GTP-binding protein n=1 Tax=Cryptococcus wingfieldii CBS 7118 TaxID=1295528 RepID=A0A1E3K231_9TREE|nr:nuclear GTP-binding protein [Cryptococcus wingfieldii CBS 7118]ODO07228.1 nuclear GTP-binding protein [Cryptococcus wingfieldii CBS 7118]
MPRIRKKTSNRQNTRDRAKITKKAAEQKRKNKKAGKKDQTWKSNKKADPGVPNSYPFKDQVLAEIAEEKRRAEEDRIARKEAAKTKKQEEEEVDTPGISSVLRSVMSRNGPLTATSALPVEVEEEDSDIPELIDTALPTLQEALDRADVICEVVDARDVLGGRSAYIEGLVKEAEGRVVLIVNKIDLVPREALQSWLSHLDIPTFLFKSALPPLPPTAGSSKNPGPHFFMEPESVLGRTEFLAAAKKWSQNKKQSTKSAEPLVLALMGLPTVGKTSILKSLLPSTANKSRHLVTPIIPPAQSSKQPQPTTKAPVEVELDVDGVTIKIIDTPGWEPVEDDEDEEEEETEEEEDPEKWDKLEARLAGDLLRRNMGRIDRVKDVFPLVNYIVQRCNHQDLMLAYNIPFFEKGDLQAFLTGLARAHQRIKKHGTPDLEGAGRVLLRDWAYNTFPYYATAPAASSADMEVEEVEKFDMTAVLEKCKGKKDMKKESAKGIVRFKSGDVDTRDIILDDDYTEMAAGSDDGSEDEDEDEDEDSEADLEFDEAVTEEGDEDEAPLLVGSEDGEEVEFDNDVEPSDDDEEAEEESDDEPELPSPPKSTLKSNKRRISEVSLAPKKKAKRVSFAKESKAGKAVKGSKSQKKGSRRK